MNVYVSDYATHMVSPDSPLLSGVQRKNGLWDLRYKGSWEAAEYELWLKIELKRRFNDGESMDSMIV